MFVAEETITKWRINARNAWAVQFSAKTPDGWSISPVDLTKIIAMFPALRLKEGFTLRAYQYRQQRDGNAIVFAMPAGEKLPAIKVKTDQPARPPTALVEVMEAINGDGSLESYMQASILKRELDEFGAIGHGSNWVFYQVLGDTVWVNPPLQSVSPTQAQPSGTPNMWRWLATEPEDYRPSVKQKGEVVQVTFYTYSGLGGEQIIRHEDTFHIGGYTFSPNPLTIAFGPKKYVI